MTVTLSVGVPNFGGWAGGDWRRLLDIARAADDAGVDRIVVNDHVVMGEHTDAYVWGRFPTGPDAPWLEPLTVLTGMASVTSRLRLATGILIAPLRSAPVLAKTVATLDVLSDGRVDLGVGVGWQKEEYDACGLDFRTRGRRLDDTLAACRALWGGLPAEPAGSLTTSDVYCAPLPTQSRLPVWCAGNLTSKMLNRIDAYADGWIPLMGTTREQLSASTKLLHSEIGRPIDVQASLPVMRNEDGRPDPRATMFGGAEYIEAGATDLYVNVAAFARDPAEAVALMPTLAAAHGDGTG